MLEFNGDWRFETPGSIPDGVYTDFSDLIGKITTQGDDQKIYERFKAYFASAAGTTSSWSSSTSWAMSDMDDVMRSARSNAPLFIEAYYEACESLRKEGIFAPKVQLINKILGVHSAGYEIRPPDLVCTAEAEEPTQAIDVSETPSLDRQARDIMQKSLHQTEEFLSEGRDRQAVQEVLWLLETLSTAFQGLPTENGTVQGKYFNKIADDLRRKSPGTTLNQVLEWITTLHGFLSSTKGGGIRHGADLKADITTRQHEARLFCSLIRSYILYLIKEHERLTGSKKVLD
jgi:hypothetical protein